MDQNLTSGATKMYGVSYGGGGGESAKWIHRHGLDVMRHVGCCVLGASQRGGSGPACLHPKGRPVRRQDLAGRASVLLPARAPCQEQKKTVRSYEAHYLLSICGLVQCLLPNHTVTAHNRTPQQNSLPVNTYCRVKLHLGLSSLHKAAADAHTQIAQIPLYCA